MRPGRARSRSGRTASTSTAGPARDAAAAAGVVGQFGQLERFVDAAAAAPAAGAASRPARPAASACFVGQVEVQVDAIAELLSAARVGARGSAARSGCTDCGIVLAPSGSTTAAPAAAPIAAAGRPPGWYSGLSGSICAAELLRLGPVLALATGQREQLRGQQLEALGVAPLGVDLEQLGADRQAVRVAAHRLLEDLLGLQVAAVGEVDVGLGHRVDVADRVELAQRVAHRRRSAARHRACRCAGRRWRRRTNRAAGGSRGTRSRRCPCARGCASGRCPGRPAAATAAPAPSGSERVVEQRSRAAGLRSAGGRGAAIGAAGLAASARRGRGVAARRRGDAGQARHRRRAAGAGAGAAAGAVRQRAPARAAARPARVPARRGCGRVRAAHASAGAARGRRRGRGRRRLLRLQLASGPRRSCCSSATRVAASFFSASFETLASALGAAPPLTAPCDSVSLSGVGAAACLRSSTLACDLAGGLARAASSACDVGHAAGQALAVGAEVGALRLDRPGLRARPRWLLRPASADGTASTTPAFSRFMLLPMKASGWRGTAPPASGRATRRRAALRPAIVTACRRCAPVLVAAGAPAARAGVGAAARRGARRRRARRGAGAGARRAAPRPRAARRRAARGRGCRRGAAAARPRSTARSARRRRGGAALHARRIEQQRVFAHQAAGRPGDLEDHVDEGLLHPRSLVEAQIRRGRRRGAAARPAVPAARRCSRRRRRDRPRAARRATRRLAASSAREAGDVDLGAQRFAERGLHRAAGPGRAPQAPERPAHSAAAATPVRAKRPEIVERSFQGVSQ